MRDPFDHEPRPGELLDRHLNRVGARQAVHQDPASALQLNMLRMLLDVLHSACDDEDLDPRVTRRILDKVIYGGVPQRPVVEQMLAERSRFAEHLAGRPTPWIKNPHDIRPGMIVMGDGSVITPEEYERREAALTDEERRLRDILVGRFGKMAQDLREAHEADP
jgi:hypothetical protein